MKTFFFLHVTTSFRFPISLFVTVADHHPLGGATGRLSLGTIAGGCRNTQVRLKPCTALPELDSCLMLGYDVQPSGSRTGNGSGCKILTLGPFAALQSALFL